MKNILFISIFGLLCLFAHAQQTPSEQVNAIKTENAIQIIEAAAKDLGCQLDQFDRANKILITDWIEWNSIAITNHARLKFEAKNDKVYVSMIDRQYKTKDGWADTPTKLSKKNHKKYLTVMAEKIAEIAKGDLLTKKAVEQSVLIKSFLPSVMIDGCLFEFIRLDKNVEVELSRAPNMVLQIGVTNTTHKEMKIVAYQTTLYKNKGKSGTVNGYSAQSFDKLTTSLGGRITKLLLKPAETRKYYLYSQYRNVDYRPDVIDEVELRFSINDVNRTLLNYNIPIPFVNKLSEKK